MGDMVEKVARAILGLMPNGRRMTDLDAELYARAALEACCFEELVKALKVYANPEHWQEMTGEFLVHETDDDDRIVWDAGELARAVLAKVAKVEASDG